MTAPIPGCEVLSPMEPRKPRKPASPARIGKGRFAVLNAFVDATLRSLRGADAKVWIVLYRDTKPNGLVRVSDVDLGRRAGMHKRSVMRARARLTGKGLLFLVRRGGLRTGPSVYRVMPLQGDNGVHLNGDKPGQILHAPVSPIPEEDQKGRLDPFGSDAKKKNKERGAGGGA